MTEPCNRFGMASILALIMMLGLCWIPLLTESAIGVNWGTVSFCKLKPSTVVDLLKDNKITKVKLFEAEADVLKALMGSGIQVMVGIPNEMLSLLSSSPSASDLWIRQNISAYTGKGGADIRISHRSPLGTVSFCKLKPSAVVDLLKDNRMTKVKLFEAEAHVLKALMGGGIQVMVGVPNEMLSLLSSSPAASDLGQKDQRAFFQVVLKDIGGYFTLMEKLSIH